MDNGMPWGTQSKLPSALGLWLVGIGVSLIYGRPARSTDNAVVERSHGVLDKWVEPHTCEDFADCEARLAWAVHTQRERYPVDKEQSRIQKHPDLYANPRGYDAQHDSQICHLILCVSIWQASVSNEKLRKMALSLCLPIIILFLRNMLGVMLKFTSMTSPIIGLFPTNMVKSCDDILLKN